MAANEFANLARTSFAGIEFPVDRYRLGGSSRVHIHIYAHVAGGDIEKLGRDLYEAEVHIPFLTSATKYMGGAAGPLWPNRLATLRRLFEEETTDYLVLPSVGRIKMMCTKWDQEFDARVLNGEHATFRFVEDQSTAFLLDQIVNTTSKSVETTSAKLKTLSDAMRDAEGPKEGDGIFDTIQKTANSLLAIRDQVELGGLLLAAKIEMLTSLCAEADKTVQGFQSPQNFPVLDAMKELWAATVSLGEAVLGPPTSFAFYETPARMTVTQISIAIFGTSERTTDILELNPIANAYDIPARTSIRYIPDDQAQAA
jgi:hypothetical protein